MSGLTLRTLMLLMALALNSGLCASQALPTQTSEQTAVTVKVTPLNLQGDHWEFRVVFDTHSQELTDDLLKAAVLVTADGTQVAPAEWRGHPPGGHHREGVLRFNALKPAPATVHLRISRPDEPKPRSFRWDLRPSSRAARPTSPS